MEKNRIALQFCENFHVLKMEHIGQSSDKRIGFGATLHTYPKLRLTLSIQPWFAIRVRAMHSLRRLYTSTECFVTVTQ